jgi:hypothetical protein
LWSAILVEKQILDQPYFFTASSMGLGDLLRG